MQEYDPSPAPAPALVVTIELPPMPETLRYQQARQVPELEAFLVWLLNNGYQLRTYDPDYGEWDAYELADPAEVTKLIQSYLEIDAQKIEAERFAVYRLVTRAVNNALDIKE